LYCSRNIDQFNAKSPFKSIGGGTEIALLAQAMLVIDMPLLLLVV